MKCMHCQEGDLRTDRARVYCTNVRCPTNEPKPIPGARRVQLRDIIDEPRPPVQAPTPPAPSPGKQFYRDAAMKITGGVCAAIVPTLVSGDGTHILILRAIFAGVATFLILPLIFAPRDHRSDILRYLARAILILLIFAAAFYPRYGPQAFPLLHPARAAESQVAAYIRDLNTLLAINPDDLSTVTPNHQRTFHNALSRLTPEWALAKLADSAAKAGTTIPSDAAATIAALKDPDAVKPSASQIAAAYKSVSSALLRQNRLANAVAEFRRDYGASTAVTVDPTFRPGKPGSGRAAEPRVSAVVTYSGRYLIADSNGTEAGKLLHDAESMSFESLAAAIIDQGPPTPNTRTPRDQLNALFKSAFVATNRKPDGTTEPQSLTDDMLNLAWTKIQTLTIPDLRNADRWESVFCKDKNFRCALNDAALTDGREIIMVSYPMRRDAAIPWYSQLWGANAWRISSPGPTRLLVRDN